MKAPIYSKTGNKKGEVVLNPAIFSARVNDRLLEIVKNAYSANLRHGTADTKVRKEVRGGGKKPWKQKGTGRARHGSTRSPIWKGGGTVFGPHPRSYFTFLSRSMKQQALISALSLRGEQKSVLLIEDMKLESAKTKEFAEIMKSLPLEGKRALCIVKEIEPNLARASQNLEKIMEIRRVTDVNAFHVLQRQKLVIEEEAINILEKRLLNSAEAGETAGTEKSEAPAKKVTRVKKAASKTESKKKAEPKKGKS